MVTILSSNQGSTGISLTRLLSYISGADHVGGKPWISFLAHRVACHSDVNLLEGPGLASPLFKGSPTSDSREHTFVHGLHLVREAHGAHFAGERDVLRQTKDGIVVVVSG